MLTATVTPAFDHIIERPRLIARIVEGDARVTMFAAAAGYGKTTLARQWADRQTGPVVWYRATRASGDVAALAVGLDELLASIAPELRRDPRRVARIASVNPSPKPLGRALVQTYEPLTEDVLLIVDEWEAAGTEEAEQLLSTLVDQLHIRFLITTRTRPAWFTPRLEVYGEGLEIGVDELAMTDEEATEVLFNVHNASRPSTANLGGWPAAIGLAAIQHTRNSPPKATPPTVLYDFLATEVLGSVPAEVVHDLTLLAVAAVNDVRTARDLLGEDVDDRLHAATKFGLLRETKGDALFLHPLLREHLISLVRSSKPLGLSERLTRLLETGRWEHALAAAEAIPDSTFATTALERALPELLTTGRVATLRRWIAACRRAEAGGAVVTYAEAELAFREADFDRAIALAELSAEELSGDMRSNAHLVAARAANLAERAKIAACHAAAARQTAKSPGAASAAAWATFLQAVDDEKAAAEQLLDEYSAVSPADELRLIRVSHGRISLSLVDTTGLENALDDAGVARTLLGPDIDPLARSSFLNMFATGAATAARYRDSLDAALLELAVAEECDFEFVRRHGLLARARALIGLRDLTPAEKALRDVERRLQTSPDAFLDAGCAIERARLYITLGDHQRAFAALAPDPGRRLGRTARGEYLALRALVLASSGELDDAVASADRARSLSRALPTRCLTLAADAVAKDGTGALEIAQSTCSEILKLGGADALVLACRASHKFAEHAAASPGLRSELIRLFVESHDQTLARRIGARAPRSVRRAAELSPREAEIHQLIAQGLTNPEISQLLFISPSTTKVHVRHILEKLGVRSRVEAARVWEADSTR